MAKLQSYFLKQGKSNPKEVLQFIKYKESVQVSGEIFINFKICYTLNTISFNRKKLKIILGELETHYINYKYGTKEIELLQSMKGIIVLKIKEVYQQKMLEWKEDGSPQGK